MNESDRGARLHSFEYFRSNVIKERLLHQSLPLCKRRDLAARSRRACPLLSIPKGCLHPRNGALQSAAFAYSTIA